MIFFAIPVVLWLALGAISGHKANHDRQKCFEKSSNCLITERK